MSKVIDIVIPNQLQNYITQPNKLSIVLFTSRHCAPCVRMEEVYNRLSQDFPKVNFIRIDANLFSDIAKKYKIILIPAFVFMKNGQILTQLEGTNIKVLRNAIKSLS